MNEAMEPAPARRAAWPFAATAAAAFAAVTLILFGDVLFSTARVFAATGLDLTAYFVPLREYGFSELARGRLPVWNPYSYSGTPYVANVQTALFYPPNWVYLVLPTVVATNVSGAFHFFLAGWLTSLWAHALTGARLPALLAGMTFACCGGYFPHLYPGHLTLICAGAWLPLLLLAVDQLLKVGALPSGVRWVIAGAIAVAAPVLAGHPQTGYYSAIAAILYAAIRMGGSRRRVAAAGLVAAMFVAGGMLSAVQLAPTWALASATTREQGLSPEAAYAYALPVESLASLLVPHLLGSAAGDDYLGRWFWWETSLFVGAVTMVLAAYAVATTGWRGLRWVGVLVVLVLLSGVWRPAHEALVALLPGYGMFRAAGRFGLQIDLLLAGAAAVGLAALMRRTGGPPAWVCRGAAVAALVCGASAILVRGGDNWARVVRWVYASGDVFLSPEQVAHPAVIGQSMWSASVSLAVTAGVLVATTVVLAMWHRRGERWRLTGAGALAAIGALNVLVVAWSDRVAGRAWLPYPGGWARAVAAAAPGNRVMTVDPEYANVSMARRFMEAGGYDPIILGRYAQYVAISQGLDPAAADAMPGIEQRSPLFRALRIEQVLHGTTDDAKATAVANPLPQFHWVRRHRVYARMEDLHAALAGPGFDPSVEVLLESEPVPAPDPAGADGTVRILRQEPARVEIEVTAPSNAILLMTDAYAPGWRVVPLAGGGVQERYEVLPANLGLRAIPLAAGRHRLRIEYVPPLLAAGAWISGGAVVVLAGAWVVVGLGRFYRS